ncbi:MAG TPA: MamI family restriction endonuclease [Saprospiraceae bacterium]|nr:MamI family restriction endonuclease [Saprospiraceae bacterium]HRX21352.1 MamI family restriction endonuclease [Syntrophomonadaceae bacterium]
MELSDLNDTNKEILAKKFIEEVILPQWKQLVTWNKLTFQTAQLDFGYLSQHLVSILSGIKGNNQRGKGADLEDGSEVKSASFIDAIDKPRWNKVNCGAVTTKQIYQKFNTIPFMFFVLLDTTVQGGDKLRCRVWCVRPMEDDKFMYILTSWSNDNDDKILKKMQVKTNLQLHPPSWEKAESNITSNSISNLKLPLIYHSEQLSIPEILVMETKYFNPALIYDGFSELIARD